MNENIGVYFILIYIATIRGEFVYRNPSGSQEAITHTLARYRRYTRCESNLQFQCDSNDCVSKEMVCDGKADCPNADDEKLKECEGLPCNPHTSFRCDYGPCLS
ncbi:hypothetical protein PPYR_13365 [Photinus pyralis]|uniref:Uncharacterized protein n=1 Tax=Photinus pyralis TaxID=7054 RepID=A0A5N4A8U8_PHOPY|nr:hypothetical protein PPYR_13365 [Photinus pyralis]